MKKWNRFASAGLAAVLAAGMMAGCGQAQAPAAAPAEEEAPAAEGSTEAVQGDMPVVNMVMPAFVDYTDAPMVEEELNKILGEKYGINAKLTYISVGAWVQQTNLLLTGSECDVIAGFITPLTSYVNNGQILALDDYLAASPDMQAVFSEVQLKGTQVNGKQYALSNFHDFAGAVDYWMDESIVKELNIDVDSIHTLDDIEEVLNQVHEAHPEIYPMVPQHDAQMLTSRWTWDDLGVGFANAFTSIGSYGEDMTVQCTYENPDFVDFTDHMHRWYENGLIMADALSNTEPGDALVKGGKAFSTFANGSINKLPDGIVAARIIEPWCMSSAFTGVTYCINANSANPDAAWKLMEAVYTDPEVATVLECGIEGTHYVKNEDGTISFPEGIDASTSTYGGAAQAWTFPNAQIAPVIADTGEADYYEKLAEFNNNARNSKAIGFMFDSSSVTDAYSACLNIHQKYFNALLCGAVDPAEIIPQAVEELKAAGMDDIIAEEQKQLDAFQAQ